MKRISILILIVAVSLTTVFVVNAQSAETIWIQTNTTDYKTRETVIITINAISTTPIQGFNAKIRYDPACLLPEYGTSPIPGMNGLTVPQVSGLVDVSYASTTPQTANGALAEVRLSTLEGCKTSLNIETAALVIRDKSGFAVPVTGININQNSIELNIDSELGNPLPQVAGKSMLSLTPTIFPKTKTGNLWIVGLLILSGVSILIVIGFFVRTRLSRR